LGWIFLLFLAVGVVAPFAIFFWRYPLLKSARNLDSMLSREAAFLVNNLLLLAIATVTLWGTVYPLVSRLTTGQEVSIARPFYDQVNGPLFLGLLFLMGVGPLLPWGRATLARLGRSLLPPASVALAVVVVLLALGMRQQYAITGFGLGALVAAAIFLEWLRGTRARRRSSDESYPIALLNLLAANRPRYGGYIVHLSVVMVALGILGTTFFNTQRDVILAPGERAAIENYELRYLGTVEQDKGNRTEFVSTVEVYRDGQLLDTLRPQRDFYPSFNMAATRAAIRSTPVEDLYVVPSENLANGSVGFRILVNPLIWWMWVAGPVLILGTAVALWHRDSRVRAPVRTPAGVAAGTRPTVA
jgi:cytochrome c-type biogenesis protein CcmF